MTWRERPLWAHWLSELSYAHTSAQTSKIFQRWVLDLLKTICMYAHAWKTSTINPIKSSQKRENLTAKRGFWHPKRVSNEIKTYTHTPNNIHNDIMNSKLGIMMSVKEPWFLNIVYNIHKRPHHWVENNQRTSNMRHGIKCTSKTQKTSENWKSKPANRKTLEKHIKKASNSSKTHGKTLNNIYNSSIKKKIYT